MPGILDYLTGNDAAASPWGMLYQPQDPKLGFSFPGGFSPFPDPSQLSVATPPVAANQPSPLDTAQYPAGPIGAPAGFGAGATPFGFAGPAASAPAASPAPAASSPDLLFADRFAPALEQPMRQMAARPATDLSSVNRPAATPAPQDQAEPIAVGKNYQMPRFGSADDFEPDDATPANAKPAQGVLPGAPGAPAPLSFGGSGPGIGDRLGMAARGFMGNLGAGPIGALMAGTGSLLMGRESDPTAIARGNVNATGMALLKKGAPLEDVQAAVTNPTLMTSLLAQYYGKDKYKVVQTGETPAGKVYSLFNESDGTFKPIPGQAGGGAATGAGTAAFSLPENYDPKTRRDESFIKALDPVTRQVVEAAYNGDNVPQGRNLQKYMPVVQRAIQGFDPSSYQARMSFNREMGSGKAGYGMQVSGFQQGLEHLGTIADSYLKKGNVNGFGFPDVAHFANAVGEHMSNDQAGAAISIQNEGQQAAGEVGKLFSGSQGGGVHEREQTKGYLGNSRASGPEAAAGLESTLDLMMGGLSKLEQARDRAYDGNAPAKYNFLGEKQQAQIDRIRAAIQQLKSGAAVPAAPAAGGPGTAAIPPGWSVKVH